MKMIWQFLRTFRKLFPQLNTTEALIVLWTIDADKIIKDTIMVNGKQYMILTPKMLKEALSLDDSDRHIRRTLKKIVDAGAMHRIEHSRSTFAYYPTDRAVMALHLKPDKYSIPDYIDGDTDVLQADTDVLFEADKDVHHNLLYKINNIYCPNRSKRTSLDDSSSCENGSKTDEVEEAFSRFWKLYPRKVRKDTAYKRFKSKKLHKRIRELLKAVGHYVKSPRVAEAIAERDLTYIPHPATWLNDWEEWIGGDPEAASVRSASELVRRHKPADRRFADLVGRLVRALEELGEDEDAEVLPSQRPQARYFSAEELAVMDSVNRSRPFIYEDCTVREYATYILSKLDERGGNDSAA
ncbi:hypothetical protein [Hydrogenimonas urashimensis]|uniref:hypothetical protein n=1 Tax=Hydrogenimonas urashimensis TaxID=2740515 RepID=UPI0019166DAB|nr:hypothetical protein [Hydrogenimonas urashimensis]